MNFHIHSEWVDVKLNFNQNKHNMKRRITIYICLALFSLWNSAIAQTGKKVQTKYQRPSMLNLYTAPANDREASVIQSFKALKTLSKFNDHAITYPDLKLDLPTMPSEPNYLNSAEVKLYKQKISERNALITNQMNRYLGGASNLILAKWWNRDANGDFNSDFVGKRGEYSATDADVVSNKASAVNRIQEIGEQLIDKTYVVIYTITNVATMEEVYNSMDAAGSKKKDYKPVKRTLEGYQMNYTANLYKLTFNDSVSSVFYSKYWSDAKSHDANKVKAWESATFPMTLVTSVSGLSSSTQPLDRKALQYKLAKPKSMEELLTSMPDDVQEHVFLKMSQKVDEFRVKAPIFDEKPLSAKLGKKEGLYADERFFVYEIELNKDGKQIKRRKGIAVVRKIANNDSIASGNSNPSIFKQHGGKKLYQGMLIEAKENLGLSILAGYSSCIGDITMQGPSFGLEYNLSPIFYKTMHVRTSGLYLGGGITFNTMSNVNPGEISTPTRILTTEESKWSGSVYSVNGSLSKEIYFTRKGNIYLLPSFAYGLSILKFSKYGNDSIATLIGSSFDEKNYEWTTTSFQAGLGLGINLHPTVSLLIKPMFVLRSAFTTGNNETLTQNSASENVDSKWGFNKIGNTTSMPIFIYLKIRL